MTVTTRRARLADVEAIAHIHVAAWKAGYVGLLPDRILQRLDVAQRIATWTEVLGDDDRPTFVAELGSEVIGFCQVEASRDEDAIPGQTAEIPAIYVHPAHWQRGAGGLLCRQALDLLAERGFSEVSLWVFADNHRARAFYDRTGFVADAARSTHGPSRIKTLRYRKPLSPPCPSS